LKEQKDLNYKIFLKNDTIIDSDGERKERFKKYEAQKIRIKETVSKYII